MMKSQFFSWILSFAKVISRENEDNFRLAKVFSAKFVPKIVIRESFSQKFRVFFPRESFCPRKFLPLK